MKATEIAVSAEVVDRSLLLANEPCASVVICSHLLERWPMLQSAVESVERQSLRPSEIVVVIDGDAELGLVAREHFVGRCIVVVRETRGGLSAARNSGLQKVNTPLVAFLDDDAEADRDWLALLAQHSDGRTVHGVGGRSAPRWETEPPVWFPNELLWIVGCSYQGMPERTAEVRNVFGGCALYRSDLFHEIGGFRTELGRMHSNSWGCEETELCMRATALLPEGKFVYEPDAVIYHYVGKVRTSLRYVLRRSYAEGRSKALAVFLVPKTGTGPSKLRTEAAYLRSSIAGGVLRRLIGAVRRDPAALRQAGVLVTSVAAAAIGYIVTTLRTIPVRRVQANAPQAITLKLHDRTAGSEKR